MSKDMKPHNHYLAFLLAAGLGYAGAAQAQYVTGSPYLSNMDPTMLNTAPNALYAAWASPPTVFHSLATGLEVSSSGYGSLYYVVPGANVQTINSLATEVRLSFTVGGNAADYNWIGTPFILNDDSGAYTYGGLYSGSGNPGNPATVQWNGNTATWTVPLEAAQLARVQAGNDHIYSFNLQMDPAALINGRTSYDITFNSLQLVIVPEPASAALAGLGALALLVFHRRS
jgi:hypothetical protein